MDELEKVNHLYARAGFGLSPTEYLSSYKNPNLSGNLEKLFKEAKQQSLVSLKQDELFTNITNEKYSAMRKKERYRLNNVEAKRRINDLRFNWLERMTNSTNSPLQERMCLFWHGHFCCSTAKPHLAINQLNIFRKYGLGSFRKMLHDISKDAGILFYLNNQQNTKKTPNENYTRELLELFTLGKGHYTEKDIKEGARAFTGWQASYDGRFVFQKTKHDYSQKKFMGKVENFGGEEIIDTVLDNPRTAYFLCEKIYKYFVSENIDKKKVKTLSEYFYREDYDIGALMLKIFSSDWFYDKTFVLNKIKSPIDLIAGLVKSFDVKLDAKSFFVLQNNLGQILFSPPNVAGWNRDKCWISNANIYTRLNVANVILNEDELNLDDEENRNAKGYKGIGYLKHDFSNFQKFIKFYKQEAQFDAMLSYFRITPLMSKEELQHEIKNNLEFGQRSLSIAKRLCSLPEYQLC